MLLQVSVLGGILGCFLMLLCESPLAGILSFSPKALSYFRIMYRIMSVNVVFAALTYTMLCGIFAAGGDTMFGLCLDSAVMWLGCVLFGIIAAFLLHLNPVWVFLIINLDEIIKTPFVIKRYFDYKWVQNIT